MTVNKATSLRTTDQWGGDPKRIVPIDHEGMKHTVFGAAAGTFTAEDNAKYTRGIQAAIAKAHGWHKT